MEGTHMNLFTAAETTANYSGAGAAKTKLPVSKMLLLGILAGFLIGRFGGRRRSEKAVTKKRLSADDDD